jgi:hypothetical protein
VYTLNEFCKSIEQEVVLGGTSQLRVLTGEQKPSISATQNDEALQCSNIETGRRREGLNLFAFMVAI